MKGDELDFMLFNIQYAAGASMLAGYETVRAQLLVFRSGSE